MTNKSRYLIILLGTLVFAVLAPLIVLYVRGITFNFQTRSFEATGIIAISSEPKTADIFLNGKLAKHGSGDIKFLSPGEYQLELKNDGYYSWNKRFKVMPGEVTLASAFNSVYLFLSQPKEQTISQDVLDFYSGSGRLAYLTSSAIFINPLGSSASPQSYTLPKPAGTGQSYGINKILAQDEAAKNFVLGSDNPASPLFVFNSNTGSFYNITGLFELAPKMQFGSNGSLYALDGGILYSVNAENKTKNPLFKKVKAFYPFFESLYFVEDTSSSGTTATGSGNYSLLISQAPFKDSQTLLNNIPRFEAGADLFVTFEKQIFLLFGGSLYLASPHMQKLADNISAWNFNQNNTFPVLHAGQLDYYDPLSHKLNFVTRLSGTLTDPVINTSVGGAFFIKDNTLVEIELDTRNNQNQYTLYTGQPLQKFSVDAEGKNVVVLDDGILKNLVVR